MKRHVVGLLLGFAAALAMGSTAEAAKGVKKNAQTTTVHGQVVAMHTGIGAPNGKGGASLTIKVHHHKKAGAALAGAALGAAGNHHSHRTFHVTTATQFARMVGKQLQPANGTAVRMGSHVLVHAQGNHADKVVVAGQTGRVGAIAGTLGKRHGKKTNGANGMAKLRRA